MTTVLAMSSRLPMTLRHGFGCVLTKNNDPKFRSRIPLKFDAFRLRLQKTKIQKTDGARQAGRIT
jgi:hypothetical protein